MVLTHFKKVNFQKKIFFEFEKKNVAITIKGTFRDYITPKMEFTDPPPPVTTFELFSALPLPIKRYLITNPNRSGVTRVVEPEQFAPGAKIFGC